MRARPTSTRSRIFTSPRIASARRPSSGPNSRASIRVAFTRDTTTRSADGWSRSAPRRINASVSGIRSSRAAKRASCGRIGAGPTRADARRACSSPAEPAMLSRIISAHDAIASVRATMPSRCLLVLDRRGIVHTNPPTATAATIQPVSTRTDSPATNDPVSQASETSGRAAVGASPRSDGRTRWPRQPATTKSTPVPSPTPIATATSVFIGPIPLDRRAASGRRSLLVRGAAGMCR